MATRYVDPDADAGGNGTTNALTGTNCAYDSLNAWEAARQGTLSEIEIAICGSADAAHTADGAVYLDGWTTTASYYIQITTDAASKAGTVWSASKYRISATDGMLLGGAEEYVRVNGLQVEATDVGGDGQMGISMVDTGAGVHYISNCLVRKTNSSATNYASRGIHTRAATSYVWNCIAYDWLGHSESAAFEKHSNTTYWYNCTAADSVDNFRQGEVGGTHVAVNCLSSGGTNGFNAADAWGGGTSYNASSLASDAPGTNSRNSQTFTWAGTDNWALAATDAGARDYGVSDPGSGLYSDDITGTTRTGTWDIGAHEYVSTADAMPVGWAQYRTRRI